MKPSILLIYGTSALLLGTISTPAMGVTIDLFQDVNDTTFNDQYVEVTPSSPTIVNDRDTGLNSNRVIGGERYIQIEKLTAGTGRNSNASLSVNANTQNATSSADVGYTARLTIRWDGTESPINSGEYSLGGFNGSGDPIGVDLTQNNHDSFRLQLISTDKPITLTFTAVDTFGNTGNIDWNVPANTINTPHYFSYSDASSVDFTNVRSISLTTSNEQIDTDIQFDFIETAVQPVPFEFSSSLGIIFCGGFFGIHQLRKRLQST